MKELSDNGYTLCMQKFLSSNDHEAISNTVASVIPPECAMYITFLPVVCADWC